MTALNIPQRHVSRKFLVIEDEQDIARLVALHLQDLGEKVVIADNGPSGVSHALEDQWDAIILDLHLPGLDGLDVCRAIRAEAQFVPIMMLTSRDTELDRVLGLEIGADDYLTKPFSIPELKARVKALMRRNERLIGVEDQPPKSDVLDIYGLCLDRRSREVSLHKRPLELTAKEFELLWFFASSPGVVFSRSDLLDKVWGYGHEGYEHTVNSHINRLRSKLDSSFQQSTLIETVWGVGYRFAEPKVCPVKT